MLLALGYAESSNRTVFSDFGQKKKIGIFSNCSGQEIYLLFLEVVLQWPFKKQREGHKSAETD